MFSIPKPITANKRFKELPIYRMTQKSAITTVTGSTSDLPYLFRQLEKLTAKETADLSTLIQKWIAAH